MEGERARFSGQEHRETPLVSQEKRIRNTGISAQLFKSRISILYTLKPLDFKMFSNILWILISNDRHLVKTAGKR